MNAAYFALLLGALAPVVQNPGSNRVAIPPSQPAGGGEVMRVYEVGDILELLGPDFPVRKLGKTEDPVPPARTEPASSTTTTPEPTAAELEARCVANARVLADIVRRDVQPPGVRDSDDLRCLPGGALIANLTPKQHEWTSAFLERLRKFDGYVDVEIRFVEGPAGVMEEWGVMPRGILVDLAALTALEERIKKDSRFNLMIAPRLRVLPAQLASLSTLDPVSFVRDWSIEIVEPNKTEIAVPRIGVIYEGLAVDLRVLPLAPDDFRLDLHVQNCKVRRPIRTASVPLGKDQHMVEVALPEADVTRQEASLALASGASVVCVTPGMDKSKEAVMIVTARRIPREQR